MATTKQSDLKTALVGKNGNSYMVTEGNKVKKVTSLKDIKNLSVNLEEDYSKLNLSLYRYFKDQDADATWRKSFVLYRMYKISYSASGLNIIDTKNYGRVIEHKLEAFPAPLEVYLFVSKLGVNKSVLKDGKLKKKNELPVNELLQEVNRVIKLEEVSARIALPLYNRLLNDKTIEQTVINQFAKQMTGRFPYLVKVEEAPVVVKEEPVVDLVMLRKKLKQKVERCGSALTIIDKVRSNMLPNRSFTVYFNKLVRGYEDKSYKTAKFKKLVIELILDDVVFIPKVKPAAKFVERSPIIIEELVSNDGYNVVYKKRHTEYKTTALEMYATDLCSADPRVNVGIAKLLKGEITPEQFIEEPIIRDKFVTLEYASLKNIALTDDIQLIVDALEDVMLQWQMQNPLHFIYSNEKDFKIGTKIKVYFRDTFTYHIGVIHKYEGGYKIRYDNYGEIAFLLKHQDYKVIK